MPDKAASVIAKLKNKAKESNRNVNLCLQLFAQEEFMRRMELSKYSDNFILKGGLLIYCLSEFESRATVDIDFLMKNASNSLDNAREMLEEIINIDTGNDYIRFQIIKVEAISINRNYPGVGFTLMARMKNLKIRFTLDIGIGDVVVPKSQKRKIPTQLDGFISPEINTYSLESTIAEKIDAILDLKELSSRMKDYFDIYYLSTHFEFNDETLALAIKETFNNRDRSYSIEDFDHVISLGSDESMIRKWNAFCKKLKIENIEFTEVVLEINKLLRDVVLNI